MTVKMISHYALVQLRILTQIKPRVNYLLIIFIFLSLLFRDNLRILITIIVPNTGKNTVTNLVMVMIIAG